MVIMQQVIRTFLNSDIPSSLYADVYVNITCIAVSFLNIYVS